MWVQGSTDAMAAADIVLPWEGLSMCIDAIRTSRQIFARLKNFLTYRIAATLQLLFFFFIAVFSLPPKMYYQANGLVGLDMVAANASIGGVPNANITDQLWYFALPRRSWKCPSGWTGLRDWRFYNYRDQIVTTTITSTASTVYTTQEVIEQAPKVSYAYTTFFRIDATNPVNPLAMYGEPFETGCDIVLPICAKSNAWIGTGPAPPDVPTYNDCEPWPFYFQLPVLMIMLITLLNDGALISIGYDHVIPNPIPERWNPPFLFSVAIVLGSVGCGASLLILAAALDSNNPDGIFAGMGLPPLEYSKVVNMLYLQVSLTAFLTLFSARTQDKFFFQVAPSPILFSAAFISLVISTFLASFWPEGDLDGLPVKGLALGDYTLWPLWVWIYCIAWWIVQDCLKVLWFKICYERQLFQPFTVDRRMYEELHAKLPKAKDDHH